MDEETQTTDVEETETTDTNDQNSNDQSANGQVKETDHEETDTTVAKLQQRLQRETKNKHDLEHELADLQKQVDEFAKDKKSVKKLSDEDKAKQAADEKDQRIAELESQINRQNVLSQTRAVFEEDGLNVNDDVLGMVVSNDDETTYKNVLAIKNLINSTQETARKGWLKGETPKDKGNTTSDPFTEKMNKYK